MPTYLSKPKSYSKFERSTDPVTFKTYDKSDAFVCWIDLLGVRGKPHADIVKAVKDVLDCATENTSTGAIWSDGTLVGTPNKRIQYSLVGDALILVKHDLPETPAAATLTFLDTVNLISSSLNEKGLLHRGVVTRGEVSCFKKDEATIITGAGVVKAANLESSLKCAGLFYDQHVEKFILGRQKQVDTKEFCVPFSSKMQWDYQKHAPGLAGVCFSQYKGWENWASALASGLPTNDKVVNGLSLTQELKKTFNLP